MLNASFTVTENNMHMESYLYTEKTLSGVVESFLLFVKRFHRKKI